jgi:hypothetical protein
MRTTVNLDDDVHELASIYAAARGVTLSVALSELVRRSQPSSRKSRMVIADNGLAFFPADGRVLTMEMIKALQDDEI